MKFVCWKTILIAELCIMKEFPFLLWLMFQSCFIHISWLILINILNRRWTWWFRVPVQVTHFLFEYLHNKKYVIIFIKKLYIYVMCIYTYIHIYLTCFALKNLYIFLINQKTLKKKTCIWYLILSVINISIKFLS